MSGLRLLLSPILLVSLCALSQENTAPPQLRPRPSEPARVPAAGTNRPITLDVQVTDKSGKPIRGLLQQDFTVLDDQRPAELLSFRAVDVAANQPADPPVEIVLVLDAVNTSFNGVSYERDQVKKFLLQNGGNLAWPVSLVIFSETGTKIQNGSSRDGNKLAEIYEEYQSGLRSANETSGGYWGATERMDRSLKAFRGIVRYEKTRPGRKLMIWFSRGWPMLSQTIELTARYTEQLFASIAEISTELRETRITVYSIDPIPAAVTAGTMRNEYYENFVKGVSRPSRALPGDLGLQVLAVQSGGRVFTSSNDLVSAISDCVDDAGAFYVLSFNAARADQANEYHALAVKVDKPGVTVRTRTGYYAQP